MGLLKIKIFLFLLFLSGGNAFLGNSLFAIDNQIDSTSTSGFTDDEYEYHDLFEYKIEPEQSTPNLDSIYTFSYTYLDNHTFAKNNINKRPLKQDKKFVQLNRYQSKLLLDQKLNFNIYRYRYEYSFDKVYSLFSHSMLIYSNRTAQPLKKSSFLEPLKTEPFGIDKQPFSILKKEEIKYRAIDNARKHIEQHNPQLIAVHAASLPDIPKNINQSTILTVRVDDRIFGELSQNNFKNEKQIAALVRKKSPWSTRAKLSLTGNESSFTYWDKGGERFISGLGTVSMEANYLKNNTKWDNFFEVREGMIQRDENKDASDKFVKNEDLIKLTSNFGLKASKTWFYSANLDFKTQFFYSYNTKSKTPDVPVSGFLSPANLYFSVGMDHKKTKNDRFKYTLFLSPITYKLTYVGDTARIDESKYGITKGEQSNNELGGFIKTQTDFKVNSNLLYVGKLNLFTNYITDIKNVDFDFENIFEYRITALISLRASLHFKYDDNILFEVGDKRSPKLQFKHTLGIGLLYNFR